VQSLQRLGGKSFPEHKPTADLRLKALGTPSSGTWQVNNMLQLARCQTPDARRMAKAQAYLNAAKQAAKVTTMPFQFNLMDSQGGHMPATAAANLVALLMSMPAGCTKPIATTFFVNPEMNNDCQLHAHGVGKLNIDTQFENGVLNLQADLIP
jgi:hypothetical protein